MSRFCKQEFTGMFLKIALPVQSQLKLVILQNKPAYLFTLEK